MRYHKIDMALCAICFALFGLAAGTLFGEWWGYRHGLTAVYPHLDGIEGTAWVRSDDGVYFAWSYAGDLHGKVCDGETVGEATTKAKEWLGREKKRLEGLR